MGDGGAGIVGILRAFRFDYLNQISLEDFANTRDARVNRVRGESGEKP